MRPNGLRAAFTDQRGAALVMALILLVAVTGLALAFLSVSAFEPQISRNLSDSARARYVADAGIEWAFDLLNRDPSWTNRLAAAAPPDSWLITLVAGQPLPGLTAAQGTVTVTMRNDSAPGDEQMTGWTDPATGQLATDPTPAVDTNDRVILTATGMFGNVTKTATAVYRGKIVLPPFNAALGLPGVQADFRAVGASFTINGKDTNCCASDPNCPGCVPDATGTAPPFAPPTFGISVSPIYPADNPGSFEQSVEASVAANQQADVSGQDETAPPGTLTTGANTIQADPTMTPTIVANFVNAAKEAATTVLHSTQANPLSFNDLNGGTPGSMWGTADNPAIVYVKGDPDPASAFTALTVGGDSTGYGILIVEDGDLRINGNFRWNGPIIVTGQNVGVGFMGGGNQAVYGAVISNETASAEAAGYFEAYVTGNSKINYSKQALNIAQSSKNLNPRMSSWTER